MIGNNTRCAEASADDSRLFALASAIDDISSGLIEPVDLDAVIHYALERLGGLYGAARARVAGLPEGGEALVKTYEWSATGTPAQDQGRSGRHAETPPWLAERLRGGEVLSLSAESILPEEAAADGAHSEAQGIQSLLAIPVHIAGALEAVIQFDGIRQKDPGRQEEQALLRVVGNLIAGALTRARQLDGLRESQERFPCHFELTSVGVAEITREGKLLHVSDRLCALLGYPRNDLLSLTWQEITHPEDLNAHKAEYERLLCGEAESYSTEKRLLRKDGTAQSVILSVSCLSHTSDELDRIVVFVHSAISLLYDATPLRSICASPCPLLETTGEGIYGLDSTGKVTIYNPACARLLGYSDKNELLGCDMHSLIHHTHADGRPYPHAQCPIMGVMRTGKAIHVDGDVFWRKDGTSFPVEYWAAPIREEGRVIGVVATFSDITERRRREEERRQREGTVRRHQQALFDIVSSDLNNGFDLEEQIRAMTEIAGKTLGVARTSIWEQDKEGTRIRCLDLYERAPQHHSSGAELLRSDYPAYFDALEGTHIINADDARSDPRTCEYTKSYLKPLGITSMLDTAILAGNRRTGVLCFEHVGSPRRWTLEEMHFARAVSYVAALALSLDELRKTVAALRNSEAQVRERTEHLEATNHELKAFAYIVSHDMRAPLVNIGGYAEELRSVVDDIKAAVGPLVEGLDTESSTKVIRLFEEDLPEALGFIQRSTDKLERQIEAILQLSRVGRLGLQRRALNLKTLVLDTLETLNHRLAAGRASVKVEELPSVVSDRNALELVIGNLLDNAVKYLDASRPGQIKVDAEQAPGHVTLHIRDNGRGIAEVDQAKIFDVFRRVGHRDVPGDGMGLAYVKAVMRRLGGEVRCESVVGRGSTFSIDIPDIVSHDEDAKVVS